MRSSITRTLIERSEVLLPGFQRGGIGFSKPIPPLWNYIEPSMLLRNVGTTIRLERVTYFCPATYLNRGN